MADVLYSANEAKAVDNIAVMLENLSAEEQQYFNALLKGYSAGVDAGKRLAAGEQGGVS